MSTIKIDYTCHRHFAYYITDFVDVVNCNPETLFKAAYKYCPFIEDGLAEVAFTVYEFIDMGDGEKGLITLMDGTLLITPIRDIGQGMVLINRRDVEYVYLYDEHTIFERPVMDRCRAAKGKLSSLYGIACK